MKRAAVLILLISLSTTSIAWAQAPQPTVKTVRETDSLLNGALIGAGAGVASGVIYCTLMEPWEICREDFGAMAKFGAIGAGIGMGIDALIRKKIYQSASDGAEVHAAPLFGRRVKGVRLSLSF